MPDFPCRVALMLGDGLDDPVAKRALLLSSAALADRTASCLQQLQEHHFRFNTLLTALHSIVVETGCSTLPTQLPALYSLALRKVYSMCLLCMCLVCVYFVYVQ